MTRYLLIFSLLIISTEAYKILCLLPYHGKSHHLVFEPLLDELTRRGHQLTVVSFFPTSKPHPNRRDVSLEGLSPLNVEVIDLSILENVPFGLEIIFVHWAINQHLAKLNLKMCDKLINSDIFEEFVQAKGDYDLIIVEHFNSDCMLGLIHNYGLPSVGLSSCAVLPWTPHRIGAPTNPSYVPSMLLPFTEEMSFLQRVENTLTWFLVDWWFEFVIRSEEQRILETALGRKLPPLGEIGKNASVVLVNTHHTLNGVRVMPPSFVEVGGVHLYNKTVQPLPEHIENWISDAKDGFIVISFGSLVRGSTLPKNKLAAILNVIKALPQKILWKWETEQMEDLPSNVMLLKWLPQYDLIHHPNCVAFITHAGLLSLTEAMSAGVPILAISISLRVRAKLQSQKWLDRPQPPMETAVYYIEQTAKYKGLNMSSHARHMHWIQITLIDVIAFITIVLGSISACIFYVFKKCFKIRKIKVD